MEMTKRQLAEEWLKYALENWRNNITTMRIRDTNTLFNSFKEQVIEQAGGDRIRITIAYAWYGQMVDMGVGRGTRSGDVRETAESRRLVGRVHGNRRKPKPWKSKKRDSVSYQAFRLSVLMAELNAKMGIEKIKGSIDHNIVINF
ncbi:hypothetical protein [Pontibacter litorisediminis]|uniref:hypothetical protein n=1 Tax=Pontibacter litorisediminis TaxID=1846260 RepID=UPI0023EC30A3|nr:hypothetical protein [Pontibacter litorisediminis]